MNLLNQTLSWMAAAQATYYDSMVDDAMRACFLLLHGRYIATNKNRGVI